MRYLEDFAPGQVFELGQCIVTRNQMVAFAREFDPQSFHVDESAAMNTMYGGLIASGWHTISLFMRLLVDGLLRDAASLGSPGMDEIRWLHPVRPGDMLHGRAVIETVSLSRSKPDRGFVRSAYEMRNQDGTVVLTMVGTGMFGRRP